MWTLLVNYSIMGLLETGGSAPFISHLVFSMIFFPWKRSVISTGLFNGS